MAQESKKHDKKKEKKKMEPQFRIVASRESRWLVTFRRYKEVAENGTEFSRQDRKMLRRIGLMNQIISNFFERLLAVVLGFVSLF
jgi:hypothetical protein